MDAAAHSAPVPLIYQDEHLVAVDKPAWSVVHPVRGAKGAQVVVHALRRQLDRNVYPVHRLDRQTSGVLLFALDVETARTLGEQIRAGLWKKRYLGLCRGTLREEVRLDYPVRDGDQRRPALTTFVPLEHFCGRYTLLRAFPETGRRHQIRRHLRHLSHPLVGDVPHGCGAINRFFRTAFGLSRMFLHAEYLRLPHPTESRMLELSLPLSPDLLRLLDYLRSYDGPVA